jgi:hypothetical protein
MADTTRKTRSDSDLDDYVADLDLWLFEENHSYAEVVDLLKECYDYTTSKTSLCRWRERRSRQRILEGITRNARDSRELQEKVAQENPNLDPSIREMVRQVVFDLLASDKKDAKVLEVLLSQLLKWKDQELKEGDLKLKVERFARDTCAKFIQWANNERAKEIANSTSGNEEKIAALQALMFPELFAAHAS